MSHVLLEHVYVLSVAMQLDGEKPPNKLIIAIALGRLSPATVDVAVFTPIRPESDARVI
jgi:hypothetical protein